MTDKHQATEKLLPEPTAKEWLAASKQLAGGKSELMVKLLQSIDMPLRLVELFKAALDDDAACEKIIADNAGLDLAKLQREADALSRFKPPTIEEAIKATDRLAEVNRQIQQGTMAADAARTAQRELYGLHGYFAELFTGEPARKLTESHLLPTATSQKIYEFDIDGGWRECLRVNETPAPKRKVRAANFGSAK